MMRDLVAPLGQIVAILSEISQAGEPSVRNRRRSPIEAPMIIQRSLLESRQLNAPF
mgnify:CR=1 FL=1|jgi:hypothetical protein